jgi:membrane associated rhomboid family serine protease
MIPLSDASRRPHHFPMVTILIIGANVFVFMLELLFGDAFIYQFALVPAKIVGGQDLYTILTAMFMHQGWMHIIGNMVFFWAFGPEIEDVMGPVRYAIFYLLGGLAATFAQIAIDPLSTIPNLGASGAIAAVMGGFLVTFPQDRIRALFFFGWFIRVTVVPAILLIGLWFGLQLLSELGSLATVQSGGVAYMAHIGGVAFGIIAARLFETRRRRAEQGLE